MIQRRGLISTSYILLVSIVLYKNFNNLEESLGRLYCPSSLLSQTILFL